MPKTTTNSTIAGGLRPIVSRLDITFLVSATPSRAKIVRRLASAMPGTKISHSTQTTRAAGDLPPTGRDNPYGVFFHIDDEQKDGDAAFFCHICSSLRPRSRPVPPGARFDLRLLTKELLGLVGRARPDMLVDAVVQNASLPRLAKRVFAPPVPTESSILFLRGAEFRADPSVTRGLLELRWSEEANRVGKVWVTYGRRWDWTGEDPWSGERDRCLEMVSDL